MVFYLVGLGLGSEKDITVAGLEVVKKCALVLLESYTAILPSVRNVWVRVSVSAHTMGID